MRCADCRFWDHARGRTAEGRLRPRAIAPCKWEWPDLALPDSISRRGINGFTPTRPHSMGANDGTTCATFEARS